MPKTKKTSPAARIKKLENQLSMANDALEMALAVSPETDSNFFPKGMTEIYSSRVSYDRARIFTEALRAWRVNPIARRIVALMRTFTIGKGVTIKSDNPDAQTALQRWWQHPLNKFDRAIKRWKDETTRTGNLFLLCTIGFSDTLYVRAIPTEAIEEIKTKDNDIEQETAYVIDKNFQFGQETFPSFQERGESKVFIVHFATNQPVGSAWGESDLAPMLVWIGRFTSWLEDRVRLNRFRTAFNYIVQMLGEDIDEKDIKAREKELNLNPPSPGKILVTGQTERWGILSANLDSFDSNMDGNAVKKNILTGLGFPMHWFAEPEGSNKTTAEAAGTPTFRTLEESQKEFFDWLAELGSIMLSIKEPTLWEKIKKSIGLNKSTKVWIEGQDITERDNAQLALAFARAYPALAEHYDRGGIDNKEFNRLVYKFIAEVLDENKTPAIKKKPLNSKPVSTPPDTEPESGEQENEDE